MTYRTLLALHPIDDALETLAPAIGMALALEAHLDVIVLHQASVLPTMVFTSDSPRLPGDAFIRLLEATDQRASEIRDHLQAEGVSATVLPACQQLGLIAETVAHAAVYADLVLMNGAGTPLVGLSAHALDGALLQAGRPVLLTPTPTEPLPVDPDRVLIAWDASPQAARAVQAALPLLSRASEVRVAMLEAADRVFEKRAKLVDAWMTRHGIDVTVERIARDGAFEAHALRNHVTRSAPDLLVMGAYGHGKLRERVLGGATHVLVSDLSCPTLLAS